MGFKQLKVPRSFNVYTQVGEYESRPVYVSSSIPIEVIAFLDDAGIGFCFNNSAYSALLGSPNFKSLIETICENLDRHPLYHEKPVHNFKDQAVLRYLKDMKILQ